MLLGPPPRRRRRRWPVVLFIAAVALGIAVLVTNIRTESRILSAYLNTATSAMSSAERVAGELNDVAGRLGTIERPALEGTFAGMEELMGGLVSDLSDVEVPKNATLEHARLLLATESWGDGLERLRQGVLGVADGDESSEEVLSEAVLLLRIGDRSYRSFTDRLPDLAVKLDTSPPDLPSVRLAGPLINAAALAARVGVSEDLALRRDLAVASVRLEPRPLAQNDDGVAVIPLTEELSLQIGVQNVGNVPEEEIEMIIRVSGAAVVREVVAVGELAPGASKTELFSLAVAPGGQYALEVAVTAVADEANGDNNVFFDRFLINSEREASDEEGG
jgi:hypothetical protein